jgi:hypothetical protein
MQVSYVVAIKRISVLISTMIGYFLFGESVAQRIPYILVMMLGMFMIIYQPSFQFLHHNHRT